MDKLNELERSAKWNADDWDPVTVVGTKDILAIAEAFRELEKRAEAAEAQLAELAKQEPDYFLNRIESSDKWGPETDLRIYESQLGASKSQDDHGGGIIELFTRPAPAVSLAELVPPMKDDSIPGKNDSYINMCDGWNSCRAAILRNIEGAK